jgi:hypothetical protein
VSALAPAAGVRELRRIHLGMIDAVLAGGGVAPVAALAAAELGGTVAIVLPEADLSTGEQALEHYVSERLLGRPAKVPAGVVAEVPVRSGDETLGYVLHVGVRRPDAHEVLELAALAALTAVTLRDVNVTQRRANAAFFEELRGPRPPSVEEAIARAARLGADLSRGASALCVRPAGGVDRMLATIRMKHPGSLAAVRGGLVEALIPGGGGLSPVMTDFGAALRYAELALELGGGEELLGGSWRLLLGAGAEERQALIDSTLAGAPEGLLDTLRVYLAHGANMNATAAAIHAHRHTVRNRLERLRELTGHDPQTPAGQAQLALGLQALRVQRAATKFRVDA